MTRFGVVGRASRGRAKRRVDDETLSRAFARDGVSTVRWCGK